MKRILIIFLLLFACNTERKKIVIGVDEYFPPMTFKENGELKGIDIDLAKAVFKKLGYEVEFKTVVWEKIIEELTNKNIDIIWSGFSITEERKAIIDFTIPYIETKQVIVTKYNSSIEKKEDLSSKIVGVQKGSTGEHSLKKDSILTKKIKKIVEYETVEKEIKDLEDGKLDAIVIDEIAAKYFLAGKAGNFKILNEHFGYEIFAIGLRKEDSTLKEKLNKALEKIMKDGTEEKIFKKWLGENRILSDYLKRKKH
ncbi:MAG: amino acid ABC transporter substrate-binding protein [Brevinematales bacterium]